MGKGLVGDRVTVGAQRVEGVAEVRGGPEDGGVGVWDGDRRFDDPAPPSSQATNPDPGADMFCDTSQELTLRVDLNKGPRDYTFHPDRGNVVSYCDVNCVGRPWMSDDQARGTRTR